MVEDILRMIKTKRETQIGGSLCQKLQNKQKH